MKYELLEAEPLAKSDPDVRAPARSELQRLRAGEYVKIAVKFRAVQDATGTKVRQEKLWVRVTAVSQITGVTGAVSAAPQWTKGHGIEQGSSITFRKVHVLAVMPGR